MAASGAAVLRPYTPAMATGDGSGPTARIVTSLRRLVNRLEVAQVKRFGRSVLSVAFRTPVLVLTTTGRVSGRKRDTTLAYLPVADGSLLVVGGAAGQKRVPDWVANLRAGGAVEVTVDRSTRTVRAVELEGSEREAAWEVAVARWPRVRRYEARAGRPVPVVRLDPRTARPPREPDGPRPMPVAEPPQAG